MIQKQKIDRMVHVKADSSAAIVDPQFIYLVDFATQEFLVMKRHDGKYTCEEVPVLEWKILQKFKIFERAKVEATKKLMRKGPNYDATLSKDSRKASVEQSELAKRLSELD
jgi:hypothetical protein